MRKQVQSILIGNGRIYFKFLIERYSNLREAGDKNGDSSGIGLCCNHQRHEYKNYIYRYEDDYNKNGLRLTVNKLKAKSVIGVDMINKNYYISKSLGALRKIGLSEGVVERAINGKYDKYNRYWFYLCDVDIDKLKDQGFIEIYKI